MATFYDDLGRLIRAIDESTGEAATYHYDAVGNILSITRETLSDIQPRFDGITPSGGRADSSVQVTISGANLEGSAVTTDNPGIQVTDSQAGDTAVTATFVIAANAPQGPGSRQRHLPLHRLPAGAAASLRAAGRACHARWQRAG